MHQLKLKIHVCMDAGGTIPWKESVRPRGRGVGPCREQLLEARTGDACMEAGGRQYLEHIVEQLSAKTDRFLISDLSLKLN